MSYRSCCIGGYMSPEYAMEGTFSIKSDIFSFGVLILEILSGRRNSSICSSNIHINHQEVHLLTEAKRHQHSVAEILSNGRKEILKSGSDSSSNLLPCPEASQSSCIRLFF
ncbi:unnamed protein product [Lactuca virosa]|uniref:Serine-threonine/tyrosine-protein kinase catalytic domain-containing protein n=1 Tax=Lactuca virosa TaxID=75947 RepID=A0AAU9P182_9ASTR|nr:unnamed protein product [Lactuca virosa]